MGSRQQRRRRKKLEEVARAIVGYVDKGLLDQKRAARRLEESAESRTFEQDEEEGPKIIVPSDFLMGDAAEKPQEEIRRDLENEIEIEVLEPNWETVQVFKMCSWVIHVLQDGNILHQDITSTEIKSTIDLLGYKKKNFQRIFFGITCHMLPAAKEFLNKPKERHRVRPRN